MMVFDVMTDITDNVPSIALITGANRGIGNAIAGRLAALGMTVLLGSRDPRRGADAARALRDVGGDVVPITIDVTDQASVNDAAKTVEDMYGRLDVLVNNAGVSGVPSPLTPSGADLDVVREVFETNFFGVVAVTNAMLPLLRRSRAARIVNMSSEIGSLASMSDPNHYMSKLPAQAAYPPSKTALNSLTVQYAKELRGAGILVNACSPGPCATDFTKDLGLPLTRTADDGAAIAVRLATLADDGPTGGFFDDNGTLRW